MGFSICRNKGDYFFEEWKDDCFDRLREMEEKLINEGYSLEDEYSDFLNWYKVYKKDDKEMVLTILCI